MILSYPIIVIEHSTYHQFAVEYNTELVSLHSDQRKKKEKRRKEGQRKKGDE